MPQVCIVSSSTPTRASTFLYALCGRSRISYQELLQQISSVFFWVSYVSYDVARHNNYMLAHIKGKRSGIQMQRESHAAMMANSIVCQRFAKSGNRGLYTGSEYIEQDG